MSATHAGRSNAWPTVCQPHRTICIANLANHRSPRLFSDALAVSAVSPEPFPARVMARGVSHRSKEGEPQITQKRKRRLQRHRLKSGALAMYARDLRFLRCLRFPLLLADPARYRRPETPARSLLWFGCGRSAALGALRASALKSFLVPRCHRSRDAGRDHQRSRPVQHRPRR